MMALSRRIHFSAAHRYYQKLLSESENKRIFGKCFNENGHGHNYVLEVTLTGNVDPLTGMIINLTDVDSLLREVVEPLDHHHINLDVPEFRDVVPTTENLALYCFNQVHKRLPSSIKLVRCRLFETENLWSDVYA